MPTPERTRKISQCTAVFLIAALAAGIPAVRTAAADPDGVSVQAFEQLADSPWQESFHDPGTQDWTVNWFLDGEQAAVRNTPEGMVLRAGPTPRDDACHAVLWTRASYAGDLKIEYEFTRLDHATEFVVILYVQATGSGIDPYVADLFAWRNLRTVPAMRTYFNHLQTYHISYAAYDHGNTNPGNDYIRARRYLPESENGLEGTALIPSYDHTGLFAPDVPYRMTVLKIGQELFLRVKGGGKSMVCHWKNDALPPITSGRIGLRHMYTREARYRDFRVSTRPAPAP